MNKDLSNHHIGKHNDMESDELGCGAVSVAFCVIIFMLLVVGSLAGCSQTPKEVIREVPIVLHDTATMTIVKHDSIFRRDSVFYHTYTKGDTVHDIQYIEHWNVDYRILHDTVYGIKEIPVEKKVTETIEIPAELSKWQLFLIAMGKWMLVAIALFLLYIASYIYGKLK